MSQKKQKLTPLMQQYWDVKSAHEDKIILFRMGDFFEMFHDDAVVAAPLLGIALTQRNKKAEDSTPMCGVPHHSVAGPINKLLAANYKVAICDQIEDPKEAKGIVKRAVTRILTPSMVYDPDQLEAEVANYICAFDDKSLAFYESTTQEAFYYDQITIDQRWRLIKVLEPSEILFTEDQKLPEWISAHRTQIDPEGDSQQRLRNYCCAVQFQEVEIQFEKRQTLSVMPLSATTLRHLEVFKTYQGDVKGSLFHCLNRTRSAPGARCLKSWLCFPLLRQDQIEARYDTVQEFVNTPQRLEQLQQDFSGLGDIERRLTKALSAGGHPRELASLSESLKCGLRISYETAEKGWNQDHLQVAVELIENIDKILAEELPAQIKDGGFIRYGFDGNLDQYIDLSENANKKLQEMEASEREKTGISSLKIRYNNVFGYYIEVTNVHKAKVPAHYLRKQTLTNAERYATDDLQELERQILAARSKRVGLENQILSELRTRTEKSRVALLNLSQKWAELDVLCSFAQISMERDFCRPQFSGRLQIESSRHPVVEMGTSFVANSVQLAAGECLLLTGPNMAGKSTIMRQIAITALMAQAGCFVAAEKAQIPVFDMLFTRIGASDHLTEGLSTFMVEMVEASEILNSATPQSLVILDELGRGTSTYDGMSLAQSLLEFLVSEKGCLTFFATHYHELTKLSDDLPQIRNAHMAIEDNRGELKFLHTLKSGPASRSYGIHVAELAGLPRSVTRRAKQLLAGHEKGKSEPMSTQLSFLDSLDEAPNEEAPLLDEIRDLELSHLTPIEALNQIAKWQVEVGKNK